MNSIQWLVLLLIGLVEGKGAFLKVSKEFADEAIKASVECTEKIGLPVDTLNKVLSTNFEDSQRMREYIYCLGVTLDLCDENGYIKQSVSKYAGNDKRKGEVIKTIDECNKDVMATDKYETLFKTSNCFFSKSPLLFKI